MLGMGDQDLGMEDQDLGDQDLGIGDRDLGMEDQDSGLSCWSGEALDATLAEVMEGALAEGWV